MYFICRLYEYIQVLETQFKICTGHWEIQEVMESPRGKDGV